MAAIAASFCLLSASLCNIVDFGGSNNALATTKRLKTPYQSPCPAMFHYFFNGREWRGRILIDKVDSYTDIHIEADFLTPQTQPYNGKIDLILNGKSVQEDLTNGSPLLFEVSFASQKPVPRLVAIYKNKAEICSAGAIATPVGYGKLKFQYYIKATTTPTTQASLQPKPFQSDGAVCGTPFVNVAQSLIVGGKGTNQGEWPWLVAFYRSDEGILKFICGATLISASYTVTAAHCIQDKGKKYPLQTINVLLFIGKYNLVKWNEDGYEKKGAKSITIHPDWDPHATRYDADVALIEMDQPVTFSNYIRPICLWNGPQEIRSLAGTSGVVVGWGRNENGELNTEFPKQVNMPIVPDSACLRSHPAFVQITSTRTFCAGGPYNAGPCQGDSGGSLVLQSGKYWFIRGIVSSALRDGESCDVNNFIVFTDVAKFVPWMKSIIY